MGKPIKHDIKIIKVEGGEASGTYNGKAFVSNRNYKGYWNHDFPTDKGMSTCIGRAIERFSRAQALKKVLQP